MIFNIQRYSLHDGSGLRSTVFMKGCPLYCPWCSNPESQSPSPELMFESEKCINCGDCISASENDEMTLKDGTIHFNSSRQRDVEIFRGLCPSKALHVVGEEKSAREICDIVIRDSVFYRKSGGGVTLSGGEPLARSGLCLETASILYNDNIQVDIETCLNVPWKNIQPLLPFIDEFICDVKHHDPVIFKEVTGGNLKLVLDNIYKLSSAGAGIRVRIPVIYGFNHDYKIIRKITDLLDDIEGLRGIDIIPYHPLGAGKYKSLGRSYDLPEHIMEDIEVLPYVDYIKARNIPVTTGG